MKKRTKVVLDLMVETGLIDKYEVKNNLTEVTAYGKTGIGEVGSNQNRYTVNFDDGARLYVNIRTGDCQYQDAETVEQVSRIQSIMAV